jgi:competence protein ComEC
MKEIIENQYKNLFLWTPFLLAFGAGLYFSLGIEPNIQFPFLITILIGAIIYKYKNIFLRAIMLFAFGFFYAMCFTHFVNTPQIHDSFGKVNISGVVTNIDYSPKSSFITVNLPIKQIDSKTNDNRNLNIRLSVKNDTDIKINDEIKATATIFHPTQKYIPDSFDFERWSYFNKISGTGFIDSYEIIKTTKHNNNLRDYIHKKSNSVLTDSLVLGYKKSLPEKEANIWRAVGLGHVWSISGFHMTLVGGWLFALFYLLFRSISYITKRIPAKYPAIICSWFGLIFYLCLSGISVATIRAFLMTTLIFVATLFGRNILSLRNAALAFLILFFINPFFVMNAGFQLSFAAIFGLLWFFNGTQYKKRNLVQKILYFIKTSFQTAFIATIFTMPFVIAHFGNIPIYSIIGNLIILPIFSFCIMPLVMVGTICALFNGHLFLDLTNYVYNFALNIADKITNLPYANIYTYHIPNTVLILSVMALIIVVLFVKTDVKNFCLRNIHYIVASSLIVSSVIIYTTTQKPLFYSTSDNLLIGMVYDNHIKFNRAKFSSHYFAFNSWREFNGEKSSTVNEQHKCKKGICTYNTKNWNLVYLNNFTSVMNNIATICKNKDTDFIVSPFEIKAPKCHAKILNGAIFIYPSGKITKIYYRRPWNKPHA